MIRIPFLKGALKSITESTLYIDSLCDNLFGVDCIEKKCPMRLAGGDCMNNNLEQLAIRINKEIEERKKTAK